MLWIIPGPSVSTSVTASPARIVTVGLSLVQSLPLEPPALVPVGFSAEKAKVFALLIIQYGFIGLTSLVLTYLISDYNTFGGMSITIHFMVFDRPAFVTVSVPSVTNRLRDWPNF